MGVVSIRLTEQDERRLKRIADAEKKKLSAYCRDKILNESAEQPIIRESVEEKMERYESYLSAVLESHKKLTENYLTMQEDLKKLKNANLYIIRQMVKSEKDFNEIVNYSETETKKELQEKAR